MQPQNFEQLERETLDEVRNEAKRSQEKHPGVLKKIGAVITQVSEKVKTWGLPEGVDLERYRFIARMYERMSILHARGELVMGKDWARVFPDASKPKQGMLDSLDSKFDVLDFLLKNYLPDEIMEDEKRYHEVRRFFVSDLDLLPALD
jgi:hypothetical protein